MRFFWLMLAVALYTAVAEAQQATDECPNGAMPSVARLCVFPSNEMEQDFGQALDDYGLDCPDGQIQAYQQVCIAARTYLWLYGNSFGPSGYVNTFYGASGFGGGYSSGGPSYASGSGSHSQSIGALGFPGSPVDRATDSTIGGSGGYLWAD